MALKRTVRNLAREPSACTGTGRSAESLTAMGGASEAIVGAVAERRGLGPFAAAEVDSLCLLRMVD